MHGNLHARNGAWLCMDDQSGNIYRILHLWLQQIIHPYSGIVTYIYSCNYLALYIHVRKYSYVATYNKAFL